MAVFENQPPTNKKPLGDKGLGAIERVLSQTAKTTGDGTRTHDLRIMRPPLIEPNDRSENDLRKPSSDLSHHFLTDTCQTYSNLAAVIDAWEQLPGAIRAGILAIVRASDT